MSDEQVRPAGVVIKVTKSDSADLKTTHKQDYDPRGLFVGTAGTLNGIDLQGNTVTNFPAQVGLMPIRLRRVTTSGTADDIWALY